MVPQVIRGNLFLLSRPALLSVGATHSGAGFFGQAITRGKLEVENKELREEVPGRSRS
jgi:hypothetical protein